MMRKTTQLLCMIFIVGLLVLNGCGTKTDNIISNSNAISSISNETEMGGEKKVIHEIVTVEKVTENEAILTNYKDEKYVITDLDDISFELVEGSKIGISYKEKKELEDGSFSLALVSVTKEGDEIVAPIEKG